MDLYVDVGYKTGTIAKQKYTISFKVYTSLKTLHASKVIQLKITRLKVVKLKLKWLEGINDIEEGSGIKAIEKSPFMGMQ